MSPRGRRRDRIREAIDKTVEEKIEEKLGGNISDLSAEEQEELERRQKEDSALKRIVSSFPSSEGYYGKLHKILTSGKEEMKHYFSALETLGDPEVEVAELAGERNWGSGDYRLRIFKHGESGVARSLTFRIDVGEDKRPRVEGVVQQEKVSERLKEVVDVVQQVKDMLPAQSASSEVSSKLGEVLAETFKSGVEAVKSAMPVSQKSDSDNLLSILEKLKTMGVIVSPTSNPPDKSKDLIETITVLKELGILGEKKEDAWSQIAKFKELGLIKVASEEDPIASASKLKTLIDLVTPLLSPSAEKATFAVEAVRVIGPHIPEIVENITSAIKEIADVSRMKLEERMGVAPTGRLVAPPPRMRVRPEEISGKEATPLTPPREAPMINNPIMNEILEAVHKKDTAFFPKLKEMLILFVGPHATEALATGDVSTSTFLSMISIYGQGIFNTEESKVYLDSFVSWLREGFTAAVPPGGGDGVVVGKCTRCGEEFEFESEEFFQANPISRTCEDCGGTIEKIAPVPSPPVPPEGVS